MRCGWEWPQHGCCPSSRLRGGPRCVGSADYERKKEKKRDKEKEKEKEKDLEPQRIVENGSEAHQCRLGLVHEDVSILVLRQGVVERRHTRRRPAGSRIRTHSARHRFVALHTKKQKTKERKRMEEERKERRRKEGKKKERRKEERRKERKEEEGDGWKKLRSSASFNFCAFSPRYAALSCSFLCYFCDAMAQKPVCEANSLNCRT